MAIRSHKQFFLVHTVLLLLATFASAEGTRTWEQSKFEDLSKGTATGVAIRSTGGLELAPAFKAISTTPSTYIWSIAADQSGNLYAATGGPARVYRITPQGQSSTIFEPKELQFRWVKAVRQPLKIGHKFRNLLAYCGDLLLEDGR